MLNIFMQDAYVAVFQDVVSTAREQTGIEFPLHIEHYVVALLAEHVDRADFLPKNSFAESLLTVHNSRTAKELGDTCLFVTGVFPNYGIDRDYYISIGQTAYTRIYTELFNTVSVHFATISDFINVCVRGNRTDPIQLYDYDW